MMPMVSIEQKWRKFLLSSKILPRRPQDSSGKAVRRCRHFRLSPFTYERTFAKWGATKKDNAPTITPMSLLERQ